MVSRQKNCSGRGTLTHDDAILLPGYIGFHVDKVDLSIPCVSSPVDTVTESSMARAMAVLGSIGIIYSNCPPEQAAQWMELPDGDKEAPVDQYMIKYADVVTWDSDSSRIVKYFDEKSPKLDFAPVAGKCGEIVDVVARDDVERLRGYPRIVGGVSMGADGEWMVGAAIGRREMDKERLEHLVKAGANVIVLDSSLANSIYQIEMIRYVKRMYPELDLLGGNVVTMSQANNLIKAGVVGLRVSMVSGSICTMQEVCALDEGRLRQFTRSHQLLPKVRCQSLLMVAFQTPGILSKL